MTERGTRGDHRGTPATTRDWSDGAAQEVAEFISIAFVRVPITILIGSMDLCTRAMRQMERIVGFGIEAMVLRSLDAAAPDGGSGASPPAAAETTARARAKTIVDEEHEETGMSDTNLNDDMNKLVEYDIVFLGRDEERIVYSGKKLVTKSMTDDAFALWITAEYLQSKEYDDDVLANPAHRIEHEDKQFLRVDYKVKRRWPREEAEYEKDQTKALQDQNKVLAKQTEVLTDVSEQLREGFTTLSRAFEKGHAGGPGPQGGRGSGGVQPSGRQGGTGTGGGSAQSAQTSTSTQSSPGQP